VGWNRRLACRIGRPARFRPHALPCIGGISFANSPGARLCESQRVTWIEVLRVTDPRSVEGAVYTMEKTRRNFLSLFQNKSPCSTDRRGTRRSTGGTPVPPPRPPCFLRSIPPRAVSALAPPRLESGFSNRFQTSNPSINRQNLWKASPQIGTDRGNCAKATCETANGPFCPLLANSRPQRLKLAPRQPQTRELRLPHVKTKGKTIRNGPRNFARRRSSSRLAAREIRSALLATHE
jgi:hypothetical protein